MKRYRVLDVDFDSRVHLLTLEIQDWWEPQVKQLHQENKEKIRQALINDFGSESRERKLVNFTDLGAAPFSIVAYHNRFLWQVRRSFVIGSYYPALTGSCALGERILNHLLLAHRELFKSTPQYKAVYRKNSFDNWDIPITVLQEWGILQPDAVTAFLELKQIRNNAIHFNPETDHDDRDLALRAIRTLSSVVESQFSAFGVQPWFIADTPGASFLRKSAEDAPFIKTVYIPNCAYVGPFHKLENSGGRWIPRDDYPYDEREISDDEFAALYRAGPPKA
jgi:hypothetical protein